MLNYTKERETVRISTARTIQMQRRINIDAKRERAKLKPTI